MERNFEIIFKNVHRPRLTITPSRVTLKLCENHPDTDRIVAFADAIASKFVPNQSYRGRFHTMPDGRYLVQMSDDKEHNTRYFEE